MGKNYKQLSLEERCTITILRREGNSIQKIAATMARSASTISREIKRNETKTKGYEPAYAQLQTRGRRWHGSRLEREPTLATEVISLLAMGNSPQQISGRLKRERGCNVISHESIYRYIHAEIKRKKDYSWRHFLPYAKSKRGFRGRRGGGSQDFIKNRISIHERPHQISERQSPGHWEADLMMFSKYGQSILVAHERYSRLTLLFKLASKEAKPIALQLVNLLSLLPKELAKTVTFDNGTEFAEHYHLNELGIKTYFCDVRSPWQKGGVENSIGRLRRVLPRKTDLSSIDDQELARVNAMYNHIPRKCLGYQTPAEVFAKQLLHFECESTFPPMRE